MEEILRYEPPSPVNARWTTRDVDRRRRTIPANSRVILITGSAGRDERKYPDPDVLDIHRKVDLHMTFGYGVHFCLGAALARMEGRIGSRRRSSGGPSGRSTASTPCLSTRARCAAHSGCPSTSEMTGTSDTHEVLDPNLSAWLADITGTGDLTINRSTGVPRPAG